MILNFFRTKREAFSFGRNLMLREAVKDVLPTPKPLTDQDRAEHLAKAQAKFEQIANKGQLGRGLTQAERDALRVKQDLKPEQIKALEAKWKSGQGMAHPEPTYLDTDCGLGEVTAPDPEKLFCSYCGKPVSAQTATHGTARLQVKTIQELHTIQDTLQLVDVTKITAPKVVCCPDCVLNLIQKTTCRSCKGVGCIDCDHRGFNVRNKAKMPIGD